MSTARDYATATLLPNGKVLIAGGFGDAGVLSSTELYDPATNTFAPSNTTPEMNSARVAVTATLRRNGKVVIARGLNLISHHSHISPIVPLPSTKPFVTF